MSVQELGTAIKNAVDRRINEEARAKRGTILNGRFQCGARSYPYKQAVDCNISTGHKVWAQQATNGKAVIVGA